MRFSKRLGVERTRRRIGIALGLAAACLSWICSSAAAQASVTIGQLAPGTAPAATCNSGPADALTTAVADGPDYVVPNLGGQGRAVITSWSHNAAAGPGQMFELKVFRWGFVALAHDGPRPITPGVINTFPARVRVNWGDILGDNDTASANTAPNACSFPGVPGDSDLSADGDLADGMSSTMFGPSTQDRENISAVVEPDTDVDGWGDESQDVCPGTTGSVSGCPRSDLSISQVTNQGPEASGIVRYGITVRNVGPDPVSDVVVTQSLPPGGRPGGSPLNHPGITCSGSPQQTCQLGAIASGASKSLALVATLKTARG